MHAHSLVVPIAVDGVVRSPVASRVLSPSLLTAEVANGPGGSAVLTPESVPVSVLMSLSVELSVAG